MMRQQAGLPTISGTPTQGQDPHGGSPPAIADADGLASLIFSYQWQAGYGNDISGATGEATFVLNPGTGWCRPSR